MAKYPVFIQDEEMSCGAYCILMILKFYGYQEEVMEIKKKARLNHHGISIKGMIACLKEYQIEAKAYEASLQDIQEQVKLPCILHTIQDGFGHFMVLYEINDEEYVIGNPSHGLQTYYQEELEEMYTNKVIVITHVGRVPDLHYQSYFCFLKEMYVSYRRVFRQMVMKGIVIAILSYVSSYFYQIFIDDIHQETRFFYMIVLSLTYGVISIVKIFLDALRNRQTIELTRAIDEDIVFDSSMKLLSLPYSFFYQDKGQIQSQLLSFYQLTDLSIQYFIVLFIDGSLLVVLTLGMLFLSYKMIVIVVVMFILIVLLSMYYVKKMVTINKEYLESYYKMSHHFLELIDNHFLIKRHHLLQRTRERSYHYYLDEALSKQEKSLIFNEYQHCLQYIVYIFYVCVMLLGFFQFRMEQLTLGQILMFYMLMSYCLDPLMNIIALISEYKETSLIYEKYKSFQVEENTEKEDVQDKITSITLDNVGYAYGYQKLIFDHMDVNIQRHLLLKGATGSGKSTLLRLLMGYDMNYQGDIYFNHQELRTLSLDSLYQHVGYVCETPTFLHMSLWDNFLCNDKDRIIHFLDVFHMRYLEKMFDIVLDEEGNPLSLGQRQIVSLIRVLCQDYDVILLDEAFSHMDSKLSSCVQRYLFSHDEGMIYIVVNHQTKVVKKGWDCVIIGDKNNMK